MVDKGVEACRNLLHKREQWQHVCARRTWESARSYTLRCAWRRARACSASQARQTCLRRWRSECPVPW